MDTITHLARHTVGLLALALTLAACGGGDDGAVVATAERPAAPTDPATPNEPEGADAGIVVDVSGLVAQPGVYRMPPGSRVHEAIEAAGGARSGAGLAGLNRAALLVDGQQVVVAPQAGEGAGPVAAATGAGAKVSINAADAAALDALPGIGPVTAQKIVDDREQSGPFASVDDLDRVPGIGPATIESLRDVVTA